MLKTDELIAKGVISIVELGIAVYLFINNLPIVAMLLLIHIQLISISAYTKGIYDLQSKRR